MNGYLNGYYLFGIGVILIFYLIGLKKVHEEERMVTEFLGQYWRTKGPGLRWNFPLLVREKGRVPIWRFPIRLFFEENPWIDFKMGGSAQLIEPSLWVRLIGGEEKDEKLIEQSAYKAIYAVEDAEKACREETEVRFRSILNNLTPEEALEIIYQKRVSWWEILIEKFPELKDIFEGFGLRGLSITVTDYRFSEEVLNLRRKVFEAQRKIQVARFNAEAAEFKGTGEGREIGEAIRRIGSFLITLGYPKEEARKLAAQIFNFVRATEKQSLFLTHLGEGTIAPLVAEIGAIIEEIKKRRK